MKSRPVFSWLIAMWIASVIPWAFPGVSAAQEEETAPEEELVAPQIVETVEAEYPAQAFAEGVEAQVLLQIDVDENGAVVDVKVVEPAGRGFDEAAVEAVKGFKLTPATKGGVAIAAALLYRYNFFIKEDEPVEEAQEEIQPAAIRGVVADMDDDPIPEAFVVLTPLEGEGEGEGEDAAAAGPEVNEELGFVVEGAGPAELSFETEADGRFEFADLPPGEYQVEVMATGYRTYAVAEVLASGEELEVRYRLESERSLEVVTRARRMPREVTRREISAKEITKVPGTSGDALRAVQNMPGVSRAPLAGGDIAIRGSQPMDSVFFFDSMSTPLFYHFGGVSSVINSDLIERIDYYPGNFSVRYGRASGGVVDVATRAPKTDRFHGYVDADIWDVGALAEGPIGEDWSLAVSARRSYIDAVFKASGIADEANMTVAPRYWDAQVIADYHPDHRDELRLMFFMFDNKLVFESEGVGENPKEGGDGEDLHMMNYQIQSKWTHRFDKRLQNELTIGFSYFGGSDVSGPYTQEWNMFPLQVRDELRLKASEKVTLRVGTDSNFTWATVDMSVPTDYMGDGNLAEAESINDENVILEGNRFIAQPAVYSELELTAIPRTTMIMGVRGDYHSTIERWSADPRFALRYQLFEKTVLKGGVGLFHQPPDTAQVDEDYGNPDLDNTMAIHYSAGVEQQLFENVEVGVEGFYKDLRNVVTHSMDLTERDGEMVPEHFDNDGRGRVYGMEAQIKHRATDRFFGWISYTLMRSERQDYSGGPWRLSDWDQTHILTAVGSVHLGWGIDVGLRFRLVSGNPDTPVLGSTYDADTDIYTPIYGKTNSSRMPMFHQLDIRIDKKWQWDPLAFTVYLDVQNVYNHRNPEFYIYSGDFSEKEYFYGLPIIPSLGLKLEY